MSETLTALAAGTVGSLVLVGVVYVIFLVALTGGTRTEVQEGGQ